ncbi:MFS transporter [Streptomyces sp. LP05-1]|uniref:MFS transporter n=1 Tax=Streptomyces pyxinae TaxID=2970734 RepID=A0ABT2CK78_9ACTN|nr:MFS transporter [Streptomyces sp. LP05-1]MCS0637818.1 MFS transporter [Streptomyces sp. LP05-1]
MTAGPEPGKAHGARPVPASRRGGWAAVVPVALGSFVLVLSELLPVGALTAIGRDLSVSTGSTGLLVVAPGLAAAVAAPVLTVASGRLDRRWVLWALAGLTALADLLCAVAPNLPVMLAGRVLLGVALGGFWAVGAAVAPRLVAPGSAHRATALVMGGISVGTVASLPLAALAGGSTGWRTAFWAAGAMALVALAAQLRLLPPLPAGPVPAGRALAAALTGRAARTGLAATALVFLGHFAAYTYVAPYLERHAEYGSDAVAWTLLAYGIAGVGGTFLAGHTLGRSVPATVAGAAGALAASTALLPLCAGSPVAVTALTLLWGAAFGAVPLSLQTTLTRAVPTAPESGAAVFVTTVQLSLASGSLLGGLVADRRGVLACLVVGAVLSGLSVAVTAYAAGRRGGRATRGQQEQQTGV